MQTWISLLAENEGSQVMDTECSKEKFFTTYKRLSCLHTFSTVRLYNAGEQNEASVTTTGKQRVLRRAWAWQWLYLVRTCAIYIQDNDSCLALYGVMLVKQLSDDDDLMW